MNHSSALSPVRHCCLGNPSDGTSQLQRLADEHNHNHHQAPNDVPSFPTSAYSSSPSKGGIKTLSKAYLEESNKDDGRFLKKRQGTYTATTTTGGTSCKGNAAVVKDFVLSNLGRVLNLQRNGSGSSGLFNRSFQSSLGVSSLGSSCKDLLDTDTEDDLGYPLEDDDTSTQDLIQIPTLGANPAGGFSGKKPPLLPSSCPYLGPRNSSMPDLVAIQFESLQSLPQYDEEDDDCDHADPPTAQDKQKKEQVKEDQGLSTSYQPKWIPVAHKKKLKDRWMNLDGQSDFIPFSPRRNSCGDMATLSKLCSQVPPFNLALPMKRSSLPGGTTTPATASPSTTATLVQFSPCDTPPVAPRRASDSAVVANCTVDLPFPRRGSLSDTLPTLPRRRLDD